MVYTLYSDRTKTQVTTIVGQFVDGSLLLAASRNKHGWHKNKDGTRVFIKDPFIKKEGRKRALGRLKNKVLVDMIDFTGDRMIGPAHHFHFFKEEALRLINKIDQSGFYLVRMMKEFQTSKNLKRKEAVDINDLIADAPDPYNPYAATVAKPSTSILSKSSKKRHPAK